MDYLVVTSGSESRNIEVPAANLFLAENFMVFVCLIVFSNEFSFKIMFSVSIKE